MAQLIKLQDYISRYETNIFQYTPQYIRLKKQNWDKIKAEFRKGLLDSTNKDKEVETEEEERIGWKRLFHRQKKQEAEEEVTAPSPSLPRTFDELKQYYLNGLLPFQLKWASTTLREKSFIDTSYYEDQRLKYYLQRFPDTYLLMYHPVVEMRKAQMEIEPLLIGPFGIEIITYISADHGGEVYPTSENSWYIEENGVQRKHINPLISLRRTETFVKSVLQKYELDFPFRKVVLAPELTFENVQEPYQTAFIGKKTYEQWLLEKRRVNSPLKHDQLKVAEALLKYCQTTSVKRPEWDIDEDLY